MRESKKREAYWDGFRDALVYGAREIGRQTPDWYTVAYQRGYEDGARSVKRIHNLGTDSEPLEPR